MNLLGENDYESRGLLKCHFWKKLIVEEMKIPWNSQNRENGDIQHVIENLSKCLDKMITNRMENDTFYAGCENDNCITFTYLLTNKLYIYCTGHFASQFL